MSDEYGYELQEMRDEDGGFMISVHCYRRTGPVSTEKEIRFDTFQDAVAWLGAVLDA